MKALKIFGYVVLAIFMVVGFILVGAMIWGVDVDVDRDGHVTVKAREHIGGFSVRIHQSSEVMYLPGPPSGKSDNGGRWEKIEEVSFESHGITVSIPQFEKEMIVVWKATRYIPPKELPGGFLLVQWDQEIFTGVTLLDGGISLDIPDTWGLTSIAVFDESADVAAIAFLRGTDLQNSKWRWEK